MEANDKLEEFLQSLAAMTPEGLAAEWLAHKEAENACNKARVAIEEAIIAKLGAKEQGAKTHDLEGFKVTVEGKLTWKLDEDKWSKIKDSVPEDRCPVSYIEVAKLDEKGAKWLRENDKETWGKLAEAITVKPAKTSVKVVKTEAKE